MEDPIVRASSLLNEAGIPYCLIGGYAVAAYGVPRFTADIDFLIAPPASRIKDFLSFLYSKGYQAHLNKADLLDPLGDVIIAYTDLPIQFICAKYGYHFTAIENARVINYEGKEVKIITCEDLIILKLKAGGPKDLWDVENLLECQDGLNTSYLTNTAKALKIDKILMSILKKSSK